MTPTLEEARLLLARNRSAEAIALLERISAFRPADREAQELLGLAYLAGARVAEAGRVLHRLSDADPDDGRCALLAAAALVRGGDEAVALKLLERTVRRVPAMAAAWVEYAVLLRRQGRLEESIAAARQAVERDASQFAAHSALGNALVSARRWEEAIAAFDAVVRLARTAGNRGAEARGLYNRAQALVDCGAFGAAESSFRDAIAVDPGMADAHWGLGRLLLLLGRYREGWAEHEWRLRSRFQRVRPELLARPRWSGEPLAGRTLFVWREQGHGDFIQFMRFLPAIEKQGGRLVVETRPGLRRLVESLGCVDDVRVGDEPLQAFDLQIPIMSLGQIFAPAVEAISGAPYLRAKAHPSLEEGASRPRVAFTFAGNPANSFDPKRSLSAEAFLPLLRVPGIDFVAVQIGARGDELSQLPSSLAVRDARALIDDFADTAAVLRACDLLITACTSTAHLGGAIGIPTWVLLWHVPDWRWLLERTDSPWYRSVRLFRQPASGDWPSVIGEVLPALERFVASLSARR